MCERPRRSWWRSSQRAAREPPWMVRARQKHALRAHVMPGGVAAVMCGPLGCLAAHFGLMRTLRLLDMIGTRRCAFCGLQPCGISARGRCGLGNRSGWVRGRACLRVRERVPCRATAVVLVVHFARPSHGQISGVILIQAMILGVLDMSDHGLSRGITRSS